MANNQNYFYNDKNPEHLFQATGSFSNTPKTSKAVGLNARIISEKPQTRKTSIHS
jgi:hypothetical protein